MDFQLFNQLIRVYERIKGDFRSKISIAFLTSGVALLIKSSFAFTASYKNAKGTEFTFLTNINDGDLYITLLGVSLVLVGGYLGVQRYRAFAREVSIKDIALFFMPGFSNQNETVPNSAIPRLEQSKIIDVTFPKFDSYVPENIIEEYSFRAKAIEDRVNHAGVKKGYVAALGSVPYLYLSGTIFRDGHVPLKVLEHSRSEDNWQLLDDLGKSDSLIWNYDHNSGESAIEKVHASPEKDIAISVSFTDAINIEELPSSIRNHCLNVKLNSGYGYDALSVESVQDAIVKEVAHVITSMSKKADKVHLFICAQASVVFKLGKLYQNGMSGTVIVHNYNPKSKSYEWALTFDGQSVDLHL